MRGGSSDYVHVQVFNDHGPLCAFCGVHSQNHSPLTPGFLLQRQMTPDFITDEAKAETDPWKVSSKPNPDKFSPAKSLSSLTGFL